MIVENTNESCINFQTRLKDNTYNIYFRFKNALPSASAESYVATNLLPAMRLGISIDVSKEISRKFLEATETIQSIYHCWDKSLNKIKIDTAGIATPESPACNRVGSFFSGGVDSFYTFLKHKEQITDLIFVHGLDIPLEKKNLREETSIALNKVAAMFGKNLIEVETNIRSLLDPYAEWGRFAHGAALASIGLLLQKQIHTIYIPASDSYSTLNAWGTSPILDYLWSTEALKFIHDGCEANRIEKIHLLSQYDTALQSLRVCWKNPDEVYNCGKCEKCIRTMVTLEINGCLERCTTFNQKLNLRELAALDLKNKGCKPYYKESLLTLHNIEGKEALKRALKRALRENKLWKKYYKLIARIH